MYNGSSLNNLDPVTLNVCLYIYIRSIVQETLQSLASTERRHMDVFGS